MYINMLLTTHSNYTLLYKGLNFLETSYTGHFPQRVPPAPGMKTGKSMLSVQFQPAAQ